MHHEIKDTLVAEEYCAVIKTVDSPNVDMKDSDFYVDEFEEMFIEEYGSTMNPDLLIDESMRTRQENLSKQARKWKYEYGYVVEDAFTPEEIEDKYGQHEEDFH
ncbi:hypothetical protein BOW52_10185 [Solemya elarraichensis gill symbiont]|uniref:Uncharacterized protein n=1 Tax=Solemya elarraichensis gill symbiont TaxID=1918949 RepID=A0A1T2KXC9_9GAMM|nr:hypothetical protein BOW52_10185 [Solemya elarraichensis gill symbiont]